MADAQNPTGHVATYADLATITPPPVDGDVYITDDTGQAWQWHEATTTWVDITPAPVTPPETPQPGDPVLPPGLPEVTAGSTIGDLLTALFGAAPAELGAAKFEWASGLEIVGSFPAATVPTNAMVRVRFEARDYRKAEEPVV
jgi:hypothetical protein